MNQIDPGNENSRGEIQQPGADVDAISELRSQYRSQRKFGAATLTVSAVALKDTGSGLGRVVVTTRDDRTGSVVDKVVRTLLEVQEVGIPLPNPLVIADQP